MGDEKNLISLKDAAKISGYSSDYIGQLIRAGKIPGKQVYTNISWMTTANAVLEYKNKGKKENKQSLGENIKNRSRQFLMEINILKLFFQTFKKSLPVLLIVIISFIFLVTYLVYLMIDYSNPADNIKIQNIENNLSF